jgi:hypothetical protein
MERDHVEFAQAVAVCWPRLDRRAGITLTYQLFLYAVISVICMCCAAPSFLHSILSFFLPFFISLFSSLLCSSLWLTWPAPSHSTSLYPCIFLVPPGRHRARISPTPIMPYSRQWDEEDSKPHTAQVRLTLGGAECHSFRRQGCPQCTCLHWQVHTGVLCCIVLCCVVLCWVTWVNFVLRIMLFYAMMSYIMPLKFVRLICFWNLLNGRFRGSLPL